MHGYGSNGSRPQEGGECVEAREKYGGGHTRCCIPHEPPVTLTSVTVHLLLLLLSTCLLIDGLTLL